MFGTHPPAGRRLGTPLAALVVSAAILLALAPAALAGTYTVYSCQTPAGTTATNDGWSVPRYMSQGWAEADCGEAGGRMGIRAQPPNPMDDNSAAFAPHGTLAALAFGAPSGTTIERMTLWRAAALRHDDFEQDAGAWKAWIGPTTDFYSPSAFDKCSYWCNSLGDPEHPGLIDANRVEVDPADPVSTMYVVGGCHGPDYAGNNYGCGFDRHPLSARSSYRSRAYFSYVVVAARTVLTDSSAPAVTEVSGSLAGSAPHAATETLSYKATDEGSGLYHTLVQTRTSDDAKWSTIEQTVLDGNGGHCAELDYLNDTDNEFAYTQPCKLEASGTATLDTTQLRNGTYRLQVLVEDAAGNTTPVLEPRSFQVANASPSTSCAGCAQGPSPAGPSAGPGPAGTATSTGLRFTAQSRRTLRVRYGDHHAVVGRLIDSAGNGAQRVDVEVTDGRRRSTIKTDRQGRYRYRLRAGRSRTVSFSHRAGSGGGLDDTAEVVVRVAGVIRIHARKTSLPHNGLLQLNGRLLGAGQGAEIQIQAQDGRRWRTIDLLTTDRKGRVHYRYHFKRATGATFLFRLKMSDQPKVGFLGAASKVVTVRVH